MREGPMYNDDSQPSITTSAEALRLADEIAGVSPSEVVQQPPADAIDLEVRKARADVSVEAIVAEVQPVGEGEDVGLAAEAEAEDYGTGEYEGRTLEQLRALARSKGVASSGSKDDVIARLRA